MGVDVQDTPKKQNNGAGTKHRGTHTHTVLVIGDPPVNHRELLVALNPIVLADNQGREYRLADVLSEVNDDWEAAVFIREVARLDSCCLTELGDREVNQ